MDRQPSNAVAATTLFEDSRGADQPMTFPAVARLELDELLEQLVVRAQDVQATQGRLRGLLHANLSIATAADLDTVLRQIVSAARQLVDARYAALGVVRDGRLVRFLHEGIDAHTVAAIGPLPQGKGLLGRLIDVPVPLRLAAIDRDASSLGFPPHHPPMTSFLGVPIQVGGRVFGNLYLTDKQGAAEFSPDDQELIQALAAAAALAIDNARLLDQVRRGHQWQHALVEITTGLLSGADPDQALRDLVHHARLSGAGQGASLSVPTPANTVLVTVAEGSHESWQDTHIPIDNSIAGAALLAAEPVLIDDPTTDMRITERVAVSGNIGPTLAVPVLGAAGPLGVLEVSRGPGDEPFDAADQELFAAFARQAALAMLVAADRRFAEEVHMVDERGQIAEQLREHVISRLFAAGLSVQAVLPRTDPIVQETLNRHIHELDAIVTDIRNAVFALQPSPTSRYGRPPPDFAGNRQ